MSETTQATPPGGARGTGWYRPLVILQVLLAMALIVWMRSHQPDYSDKIGAIVHAGMAGELQQTRTFSVRVLPEYRTARAYRVPRGFGQPPQILRAAGIWLEVPAEFTSVSRREGVEASLRTDDNLEYQSSEYRPKLSQRNLANRHGNPGLVERGAFFFELLPDRLQGARLRVYRSIAGGKSMDSVVEVDLGIDAARAAELLRTAEPMRDLGE